MRRKIGIAFMILGTVLVLAALSLFCWNRLEDHRAGELAESQSAQLLTYIAEQEDASEETPPAGFNLAENAVQEESVPEAEIDGYVYIGLLSIPALDLELPVMADWDYTRLRIAPCRYSGSVQTDDLVIAAHNYTRHFGTLTKLAPGDAVCFTDVEGRRYLYETEFVETLEPTAIEEMTSGEYALSLFTCTYGGQYRVTVRCRRIGEIYEKNEGETLVH
ncbi:MAG: sortase [Clostridiales bacterium]|nr:sortase [Clostridiales bacterium]